MEREHIKHEIRKRIQKKHRGIDEEAFALFWADEHVQDQVEYDHTKDKIEKDDWDWYVEQYERTLKLCHAYHQQMMAKMPRDVIHGNRRLYDMRNALPEEFLPAVNFTEFDELVIALMRETASYFAEQLPEVRLVLELLPELRRVHEQLLRGEPLTEEQLIELEWYLALWRVPFSPLNVLQVEDVAGIGLAPLLRDLPESPMSAVLVPSSAGEALNCLRNPPELPFSAVPLPGSVAEALNRAVDAILEVVVLPYDANDASYWLLYGEWPGSPEDGQCAMPRFWHSKTCIPAHLQPRTIVRIYQRLATTATLLVHDAQRPMRVRRPSLKNLKLALEAVTRLRAGHTWEQIASDWGVFPYEAKRKLVRVWNALGIPEKPIRLTTEEHENGETTGEQ